MRTRASRHRQVALATADGGKDELLAVRKMAVAYGQVVAVRQVDLEIHTGECVALLGANGAGKSSLLHGVVGLERPRTGAVHYCGQDVSRLGPEKKVHLGLVLVPERRQVFSSLSVRDNLMLGAYGRRRGPEVDADLGRVHDLFPVLADRAAQHAGTLSGGEQQMLALGRGLMSRPRLLLVDEPSLGLAPVIVDDMISALRALRETGLAILLVEQNSRVAVSVADHLMIMENGVVVAEGPPHDVVTDERLVSAYLGGGEAPPTSRERNDNPREAQ